MIPILVSGILISLALLGAGTPKTRKVPYSIQDVEDQLSRIKSKVNEIERDLKE